MINSVRNINCDITLSLEKTLIRLADERRREIVDLVREVVRTRSVNPSLEPGAAGEADVVRRLSRKAEELGFGEVAVVGKTKARPNLLAKLWGSRRQPVMMLIGHTDTKPVGADEKWKVPPFSGDIVAGRIYGRGSADMKAGLVSMLMAGGILREAGVRPRGDFAVAMTADEEFDSMHGVRWLQKKRILKADAGIIGEPSGIKMPFDQVHLAVRGSVHFELVTFGTQMHSALSDIGGAVNASVKLASVLTNMAKDLRLHFKPHPLYPQGPTVNLGTVLKGGVANAIIPGQASATCDIRLPPGLKPSQVRRDINAFLDRLRKNDPELRVKARYIGENEGAQISPKEPIVQSALAACKQVLGSTPRVGGFPACDDAIFILKQRDPSLRFPVIPAFGPGMLSVAHQPNENIRIEDVIKATKIYSLAALYYLR